METAEDLIVLGGLVFLAGLAIIAVFALPSLVLPLAIAGLVARS